MVRRILKIVGYIGVFGSVVLAFCLSQKDSSRWPLIWGMATCILGVSLINIVKPLRKFDKDELWLRGSVITFFTVMPLIPNAIHGAVVTKGILWTILLIHISEIWFTQSQPGREQDKTWHKVYMVAKALLWIAYGAFVARAFFAETFADSSTLVFGSAFYILIDLIALMIIAGHLFMQWEEYTGRELIKSLNDDDENRFYLFRGPSARMNGD